MKIIFTLFSLLMIGGAMAQTTTTTTTTAVETAAEPTVAELSAEIATLKAKTSKWEQFCKALPQISGYAQTGYEWSNTTSTFFIKRVRLSFAGNFTPKFDYRLQIEFRGPVSLVDAYLRYRPFDQLGGQIGEFKVPFGIENTDYAPTKLELIDYPLATQRLVGLDDVCGLSSTGRDMGAMLFGGFFKRDGFHILNYNVAVLNGEGINLKDKNKSKDVVARLIVKPVSGLKIAGSYYRGEYGVDHFKRDRYGVGVAYDEGSWTARSEFLWGNTGAMNESDENFDFESRGWYVLGGYRFTPKWTLAARYDTFLDNVDFDESEQTNYTLGVLWTPIKYLRCQLNYTFENYAMTGVDNRNVVMLQFTGMF